MDFSRPSFILPVPIVLHLLMNVAAVCISLKESERRAEFSAYADRHGMQFTFVDAVTPDDIRDGKVPSGCKVDLSDLRWTKHVPHDARRKAAPILFTEIADAYSHILCWRKAKRLDVDFLAVFEDDVEILRPFEQMDFSGSWDLKYISDRMPANTLGRAWGNRYGSEGYVLSKRGLDRALKIFSTLYMPLDLQLIAHSQSQIDSGRGVANCRRWDVADYLDARVASTPLCKHRDLPSSVAS